ncbi:MAG: pantetheine-phosphate adenylyltransferase [Actinobacteria bacterium]|nr:pantetheine-phosphate adenylyltransferase [Actinomycetota bacterium]MBL7060415.1 pantetheine-phosphate adenylyltransferase [Actinomycetota bacterium]
MKIALCPGTYDPITEGHKDVIVRCSKIFDKVIAAVSNNTRKKSLFPLDRRVNYVERVLKEFKNIEVVSFEGLLVDIAKIHNVKVIVKGLRAISDFEYEFQMAQINKKLNPELETMFLMTNPKFAYLSSSAVKEVARYNGCITGLVPKEIEEDIILSFKKRNFNLN